jgi:hypothetical protein
VDVDELPGKPPPSMEEVAVVGRVVVAAIDPPPRPRARGGGGSPTPRTPRDWDGGVERPPRPNGSPATAAAAPPPPRPRVRLGAAAAAVSLSCDPFFLRTAPGVDIPPHRAGEEGETGELRWGRSGIWRAAPRWEKMAGRRRNAGRGNGGEGEERGRAARIWRGGSGARDPLATLLETGRRTARRLGVARASGNGTCPSPGLATREPSIRGWEGFLAKLPS